MQITEYVPWKSEYSIGAQAIDIQHKLVLTVLNKLYIIYTQPFIKEDLGACLRTLYIFTETHFQYEETLLKLISYKHLEDHTADHDILKDQMQLAIRKLLNNEPKPIDTVKWVEGLWVDHINNEDMKYVPFIATLNI